MISNAHIYVAGFMEIAQLLLNTANDTESVKRMLESVDAEGDTVSINWKSLLIYLSKEVLIGSHLYIYLYIYKVVIGSHLKV